MVDNGGTAKDSAEPVCRSAPHDEDSDPDVPGMALPPDLDKDNLGKESIAALRPPHFPPPSTAAVPPAVAAAGGRE